MRCFRWVSATEGSAEFAGKGDNSPVFISRALMYSAA